MKNTSHFRPKPIVSLAVLALACSGCNLLEKKKSASEGKSTAAPWTMGFLRIVDLAPGSKLEDDTPEDLERSLSGNSSFYNSMPSSESSSRPEAKESAADKAFGECLAKLDPTSKVKVVGDVLELRGEFDTAACYNKHHGDRGSRYIASRTKFYTRLSCEGGHLQKFDGKSFEDLNAMSATDNPCEKTAHSTLFSNYETEEEYETEIATPPSRAFEAEPDSHKAEPSSVAAPSGDIPANAEATESSSQPESAVAPSSSAEDPISLTETASMPKQKSVQRVRYLSYQGTSDGLPCESTGTGPITFSPCLSVSRYITLKDTLNGKDQGGRTESYDRVEHAGVIAASEKAPWYASGSVNFQINKWKGTVTYQKSGEPKYSATNGAKKASGTIPLFDPKPREVPKRAARESDFSEAPTDADHSVSRDEVPESVAQGYPDRGMSETDARATPAIAATRAAPATAATASGSLDAPPPSMPSAPAPSPINVSSTPRPPLPVTPPPAPINLADTASGSNAGQDSVTQKHAGQEAIRARVQRALLSKMGFAGK